MPPKRSISVPLEGADHERLGRARAAALAPGGKIPSLAEVARDLIRQGLDRLESSPRPDATGEGTVTTDTKGSPR